jgi:hypothetical protein
VREAATHVALQGGGGGQQQQAETGERQSGRLAWQYGSYMRGICTQANRTPQTQDTGTRTTASSNWDCTAAPTPW